jgi:hypothetical protein
MARMNNGSGKDSLILNGLSGENRIKEFLNKLLNEHNIVVDVADTKYETYDIKLKNTVNGKIIKIELETATDSKEWNDNSTFYMILTDRPNRNSPHWPFGLNIPARKIYVHNDATIVEPKQFKPKPFDIYLRVSLNIKHFFAVDWRSIQEFLNEEDDMYYTPLATCQTLSNSAEKISNTNYFVSIAPNTVINERNRRLIVDDPTRLRNKIIELLN